MFFPAQVLGVTDLNGSGSVGAATSAATTATTAATATTATTTSASAAAAVASSPEVFALLELAHSQLLEFFREISERTRE